MLHSKIQVQAHFSILLLCFTGLLIFTIALAFGLIGFYHFLPHQPIPALILVASSGGTPKPCENFVFVTSSLVVPLVASLVITWVARHQFCLSAPKVLLMTDILMVLMVSVVFAASFASDFVLDVMNHHAYGQMAMSLVLLGLIWRFDLFRTKHRKMTRGLAWLLLLTLLLMLSMAYRLFCITHMTTAYSGSIDAPIYPISQILAGKHALVDFPEQYGNYAVMIGPLLSFMHVHSLFAVTFTFSLLLVIALGALFTVLHQEVRSNALFFFVGLALLFLNTKAYNWVSGNNDPYYQYDPIRLFWPALSVLFFYFYAKHASWIKSIFLSLIAGIAVIWNLDTGLPLVAAFPAFLLLRILFCLTASESMWAVRKQEIFASLGKIILHGLIVTLCFAAFLYLTWLAGGRHINIYWIFAYQKLFYLAGFAMLPTPTYLHPWMIVLALYLFALIFSQFSWHKRFGNDPFSSLLLYLSLLGLGLFLYYMGRSHIDNLLLVLWPAVLIATLFADRMFRLNMRGLISKTMLLINLPFLIFILVCSVNLLSAVPKFVDGDISFFTHLHKPLDPLVASEIQFINQEKGNNKECVILSQRQGIYYLESGLANPIKGPGIVEILLRSDRDYFLNQMLEHPSPCLFYGVGIRTAALPLGIHLSELLTRYQVKAENAQGSLLLLVPK